MVPALLKLTGWGDTCTEQHGVTGLDWPGHQLWEAEDGLLEGMMIPEPKAEGPGKVCQMPCFHGKVTLECEGKGGEQECVARSWSS